MRGKILTLILGILLGVTATLLWPRFVSPRLPAGLRSGVESVDGAVVRKQRDGEKLLLTVDTSQGAALATFTEKVAEIDLLVEEGDGVTLGLRGYEPFIHNPAIQGVRKVPAAPADQMAGEPAAPDDPMAPGDQTMPDDQTVLDDLMAPADPTAPGESSGDQGPAAEIPAELESWPGTAEDG